MRDTKDRIRHALSFEIIALMLVTPLGAWAFDLPFNHIGIVALVSATIATGWNYLYNLMFDHAMLRIAGHVRKTIALRILHALLFEGGLLLILLPFIAWYLSVSLIEAFLMDVAFAAFYLVYAFVYNWLYDLVFPVPETQLSEIPDAAVER
ncbi:MAG: PACE efflux transporter [Hoeflea sp.]|uniref:PACE efflux transporter n=1 Tax=Hoeflea sp. TaxID=1940281 RepID=UPI001D9E444C|nr:PACE efflux transporter [Hoeflea sp.]MBU4528743.1 PACE efflux transporter [Alphaproteobacteria bacterium]MBU4545930.1 PACE efflux transporter [Alphaproteobacteria bacterium]MBU4549877.1 PACE efflux transporter [Alphaproteobacteria bacterium]MBV1725874.1 PACE efflux transporter [Hoeflea sp.]MBV1762599.1 PACE efflux transporter [Hoeflea sp.]